MRLAPLCIAAAALLSAAACRSISVWPNAGQRAAPVSATSKEQIVALVNRNVSGDDGEALKSWRCMQAKFQMAPMPMAADGTVIVEAPRSFRLRVSHPIGGGDELDVGSNPEQFWIWQKDMPNLLTAQHADMGLALQHFRIPFQPDWVLEVMGVVPIDGAQYELRPAGNRHVELVARSQSPAGESVTKVIRVDPRRGWVTAHELWGENGRAIAAAEFSDHEPDPRSNVVLPRKIRIHWPEAELDLRITLKHLEVNPPQLPELVWQLPHKAGSQPLDMGDYARRHLGAEPIQRVEHGIPQADAAAAPAAELPAVPQSAALDAHDDGARPFPGAAPAAVPASPPPTPLPADSAPLAPPGRVRLNNIGS